MDGVRSLVEQKLEENSSQRQAMLSAIASREVVCFVGAGLSVPLKYPSWEGLMELLTVEAHKLKSFSLSEKAKVDILEQAEEIRDHFKTHNSFYEFLNILGRTYGPKQSGQNCTKTYELLAKLPFRAFITTNFEPTLEQAFANNALADGKTPNVATAVVIKKSGQDRHLVSSFIRSIAEIGGTPRIAYLHGKFDDTSNIVLTRSDFAECYGVVLNNEPPKDASPTLHHKLVWSLFATRKIIFWGCSMKDPYIRLFLNKVAHDLWEQNQMSHFVVLAIDEETAPNADSTAQEFLRYGLQPVFFDNRDGKFSRLDQLLEETAAFCAQPSLQQKGTPTFEQKSAVQPPDTTPGATQLDSAKPKNSDWLEEVNVHTAKDLKK